MHQTAVITGASRGIGRAIALRLGQAGYTIAINYLDNHQKAQSLADELAALGVKAKLFPADITDRAAVDKMFRDINVHFGPVSLLVNNAGFAQQKLFCDLTDDDWRKMFAVHVDGMFNCTQCALKDMLHYKQGHIINISSMWGQSGASCEVHYSAAKAAMIGFTKALAKELGPSNIRVNCIAPGVIATEMNQHLDAETLATLADDTPLGKIGQPDDIAQMVAFLVGDGGRFITGQIFGINGGLII